MVNCNDIFAYYTVKYAAIRDWKLGVLQKSIMLLIFIKILVLNMAKNGSHLLEVPIHGSSRGQAQQPTKNNCDPLDPDCISDFTPWSQLPYCSQSVDSGDDTDRQDAKKATHLEHSAASTKAKKAKSAKNAEHVGKGAKDEKKVEHASNAKSVKNDAGKDATDAKNADHAEDAKNAKHTAKDAKNAKHGIHARNDAKDAKNERSTKHIGEDAKNERNTKHIGEDAKTVQNDEHVGDIAKDGKTAQKETDNAAATPVHGNGIATSASMDRKEKDHATAKDGRDAKSLGDEKKKESSNRREEDFDRRLSSRSPKAQYAGPRGSCELWDAPEMTRGRTPVPGTLFLPTRIIQRSQTRGCRPSKSNGWACNTKPWMHKAGTEKYSFMAEVERFSLIINQAFQSSMYDNTVSGRAADSDAFLRGHSHLQNMYTKRKGFMKHLESMLKQNARLTPIPSWEPNNNSVFPTVYARRLGDVMTLTDVMRMADLRGAKLMDMVRPDGTTMRSQGAVLDMSIEYSNARQWDIFGHQEPYYTITCSFVPMKYYKIIYEEKVSQDQRFRYDVHGILLLMRVHGKIRVWDWTHLLTVLTTAMVSLAMANTVTDYMMLYLFQFSSRYSIIKYQPTQDFGKFSTVLDAVEEKHGANFDPLTHKAMPHADMLNDAAEVGKTLEGDDLLHVLLKFEQRLNRLDGMDDMNAVVVDHTPHEQMDHGAKSLVKFENKYAVEKWGVQKDAAD